MQPITYTLEAVCGTAALHPETQFDGEVYELAVTPDEPTTIKDCTVVFGHPMTKDTRVLVNGYQSWTDTFERAITERVFGIGHIPRAIVERFSLDAMGDYRFTGYDTRPGRFHGFTYATLRNGAQARTLTLVASLDESAGFTLIRVDASTKTVTLQTECPKRELPSGVRTVLCRYAVIDAQEDAAFDRWFALADITPRPAKPLCGYTSWYRHYGAIDEATLIADMAATATVLGTMKTDGFTRVFQIDDGWCCVGDWLDFDTAKFPHGLAPLARAAINEGLTPGLWAAPFVAERNSRLVQKHPDWLLRDEGGHVVSTGCHWSGGLALDTRNPQVRAYVCACVQTATREWGFELLKLDFLYAACMLPHDGLNRGELMADALALLREAAGADTSILACGVPLASAFGIVEYCRIGCDVSPDWDDKLYMRLLHRERVSTKRSMANTRFRGPLNQRAFRNDPDVCFLGDGVKLSPARRAELLDTDANYAGMLLTSDDMGSWTAMQHIAYQHALDAIAERTGV